MTRFSGSFLFLVDACLLPARAIAAVNAGGGIRFGRYVPTKDLQRADTWIEIQPGQGVWDAERGTESDGNFESLDGCDEFNGRITISVAFGTSSDVVECSPLDASSSGEKGGEKRKDIDASDRVKPKSGVSDLSKWKLSKVPIRKPSGDSKGGKTSIDAGGGNVDATRDTTSPLVLKSLTQPLIPRSTWDSLTGREFFSPSCLSLLAKTGIKIATDSDDIVVWKPDRNTDKLTGEDSENSGDDVLRKALDDGEILVWTGKFKSDGYGSDLPLVKTTWMLNMPPKAFAELLMDSSRVQAYNKMSLGRSDMVKFQDGIDASSEKYGNGEAKIVRNLTKPPLSKRNMEFVTLMHARRLEESDETGVGILGGNYEDGYLVVSRAVGGSGWASGLSACARAGGGSEDSEEFIRSEILLGVNLIRPVPGRAGKAEVTAVTHCNSPSVPTMLAGKVGVKGAVDFVRDVRSLSSLIDL